MNKFLNVFAMATLTFAFASIAQAQASRTWVSGVGDDANPCSRTAPCKTFAGAISKTAAAGEIDVLDPGGFGAVTITKSITIDGSGGSTAGVLVSGTNGIVVSAATTDVITLRNLDIDGLNTGLNGIQVLGAKAVHIEHCQIYGFTQNAINDNRTATQVPAAQLFVNDCTIRNNAHGIAVVGSSANGTQAYIDHCHIKQNGGFGVSASNFDSVNVLHCIMNNNAGTAVNVDTSAQAVVIGCVLNNNSAGVVNNGTNFLLADTTILNNVTGASGAITSFGNNNVRNNGGGNTLPAPVGQQ